MADDAPTLTPQQQLSQQQWQDDFSEEELSIKYKHEEPKEEVKDDKEEPTQDDEEVEEVEEVEYEAPAAVNAEDPGEFQPGDYSFEVTDKDGKTVKITNPDEADAFAEDDDNFKTAKDLKTFLRQSQRMEERLERDKESWEAKKQAYDTQVESQQQRTEVVDNMAKEFEYLVTKGMLPKIADEYKDADWSDPQIAKQEGVKEQIELIKYMEKENTDRQKVGLKPLSSILDAYNGWQRDSDTVKQRKEKEEEGKKRKAAGARVAGVSSGASNFVAPKNVSVGRVIDFNRDTAIWED